MDIKGLLFSLFKPAAPSGSVNLPVQVDVNGPNTCVSISVPIATTSVPGLAQPDGTTITVAAGVISAAPPSIISTAGITIDGGASSPATGSKGFLQVPFSGTITGWTVIGDVSGSASFTVKKSTFAAFPTNTSIVAAAPPALASQQNATSTTLTGWTTAIVAGDVLEFVLASATTVKRLVLELQITRS
jgi:hypothetical protein